MRGPQPVGALRRYVVKDKPTEMIAIMWSLFWRATVLMPLYLAFSTVMIAIALARFFLPVLICVYALGGLWNEAGVFTGIWLISIFAWRIECIRSLIESSTVFSLM